MTFLKNHKREIAAVAFFFLIALELSFLFRIAYKEPFNGTYIGGDNEIRIYGEYFTYNGVQEYFEYHTEASKWYPNELFYSIIRTDSRTFGLRSVFAMRDCDTNETFVSCRALFYQAVIIVAFGITAYVAFIQNEKKKVKQTEIDDDFDTSRLKGWKEP